MVNWKLIKKDSLGDIYRAGSFIAIVSRDGPDKRWHLSISHPIRYPTFDEIKSARYSLIPDEVTMAMIFPPRDQYVNLHSNCFHLHEFKDTEIVVFR